MKNSLVVLVLLFSTFAFCQESEVFVQSQLPIVKTIYNDSIDALFFNKVNINEIHVSSFDGKYSTILNGSGSAVFDFDVSKDGKYVITANQDNSIIIWQVKPKKMLLKFNPNQGVLKRVFFYENNDFFTLGKNGKLKKWNIVGQLLYRLNISESTLSAISNFDNKIIIGGYDGKVRIIDDNTKKIIKEKHIGEIITCVLFNKNLIYVGDSIGFVHVLDLNLNTINIVELHKSIITDLNLIDNKYLISSSWDKTIKLIRIKDYKVQKIFSGHKDYVFSLTLRNTDLFSSSRDKKIRKWNLEKFIE